MKRLARFLRRLLLFSVVAAIVAAAVGAYLYKRDVVDNPGAHMARDAIMAVIAQESPVLYNDGRTRVGVLFASEHREYIPYARIPRAWVDAITASEDARFWTHPGIDARGIARAMWTNLKAGRVVAGGSTLTQQTVKNLFYRPDRSWRSKLEEAENALRLEAHYSKEDILEFYANQFHVSSNGRGLGIAARYFFDKEVEELTPLECAYLAGFVQAPARFNPFIGDTESKRSAARDRAAVRTRHVLDRMLAVGSLDEAAHARLIKEKLDFHRGNFRYDTSILLDEVADRLERAPFPELFADLGIDNPSTAGIQVVTTLDAGAQREATYALWHHLTEAGLLMEKTAAADLRLPANQAPDVDPDNPPEAHSFSAARVRSGDSAGLVLDMGGVVCVADRDAMQRMADLLARSEKGETWKSASSSDVDALIAALPAGSIVWASVRTPGSCDLERRPQLQGAVVLLEQAQIRAMVGGNDNRNFNRVTHARRQLGSTWKPLIYDAALQLGWTPTDALDNRPNVFPFESSWYYPRPDHQGQPFVSLSLTGARSENLASVWLLYHLTDRLEPSQIRAIAELVDLAPRPGEDQAAYKVRMRDENGIISTAARTDEMAFVGARGDVLSGDQLTWPEDAIELRTLLYGAGFDDEIARVKKANSGAERSRKLGALAVSFLSLEAEGEQCALELGALRQGLSQGGRLYHSPQGLGCGPLPKDAITAAAALDQGVLLDLNEDAIFVEGQIHLGSLRAVRRQMTRQALVLGNADPYDFVALSLHPDFRVLLNMRYVAGLARRFGVAQELPPVMSMPLGAVDITLEEAALLYSGISDGQIWSFPGKATGPSAVPGLRSSEDVPSPEGSTQLIARILDRDGNVIYRADPVPDPVADPVAGRLVGDVLRNVVRQGTGRRANGAVVVKGVAVPIAGKTGTTNGYKNAAFVGAIPKVSADGWSWASGYTLAAYVGYDDNRPMVHGGAKLQGASGALPAWIGTASGLAQLGLLGNEPPASSELSIEPGYQAVLVDEVAGLPGRGTTETSPTVLIYGQDEQAERRFAPWASASRPLARVEQAVAGATELPDQTEPSPAEAITNGAPEDALPEEPSGGDAPTGADNGVPASEYWPDDEVEAGAPFHPITPPEPDEEAGSAEQDSGIVPRIAPPETP